MEKVYFIKNFKKLGPLLEELFSFQEGNEVAIKLHMGERYNSNYVRPEIAKEIVESLKKRGGKPFLFDTNVAYGTGGRTSVKDHIETARDNGFDFCEIRIGEKGVKIKTSGKLGEVGIAEELQKAKYMIVLSHVKGHCDAGFGGAIKNLGMGGAIKGEKSRCHSLSKPVLDKGKCTGCEVCQNLCHVSAITPDNGKIKIDYNECHGCGVCIRNCNQEALRPKLGFLTEFLAEVTEGVLRTFERGNAVYINVLEKITKYCDCVPSSEVICPDIGILVSKDIVAIEKASIDLINEKVGFNLFKETNKIDPSEQIEAAEKFKLGKRGYVLLKR